MTKRIEDTKGNKPRITPLSTTVLGYLRDNYKSYRQELYLPEGQCKAKYNDTSIGKIVTKAGQKAKTPIKVNPHILRHSFATSAISRYIYTIPTIIVGTQLL